MQSLLLFLSLGVAISLQAFGAPEVLELDGVKYHCVKASPAQVKLLWKDEKGAPLRTFAEAKRYADRQSIEVEVLMNGGIFEPGGIPSGLLVQQGKVKCPLNLKAGKGNFFLKPNGVFAVGEGKARIVESRRYPAGLGFAPREAVQSGPLLLIEGKVHPAFRLGSSSRLHRNGVGVDARGQLVFLMTDFNSPKFPNLYEFAKAFEHFTCKNALFLDGDLSDLAVGEQMMQPSNRFGSIIAIMPRLPEQEKAPAR